MTTSHFQFSDFEKYSIPLSGRQQEIGERTSDDLFPFGRKYLRFRRFTEISLLSRNGKKFPIKGFICQGFPFGISR